MCELFSTSPPSSWAASKASSNLVTGCVVCGKQDNLQKCSQCKVVFFCGQEHQRSYWASHKTICKKIGKQLKFLNLAHENGRDALMLYMEELKAAGVQELATVQPVHQLKLAELMLKINTRLAVETAFDRLRFIKKVSDGLKTDLLLMVSSCLIRLNRDQEAYNYLRHWMSPAALTDHDSSGPPKIFWNKVDYDLLESPQLFYDKSPSMAFMGTMFLLKLRLLQGLFTDQDWKEMMGDIMDQEAMEQARESGSGPTKEKHIQAGKLDNATKLIQDLGQIYAFVKQGQSDFWTKLRTAHQSLGPRHDCTGLETQPMLHCYRAFVDTERGLEALRNFTILGEDISASIH